MRIRVEYKLIRWKERIMYVSNPYKNPRRFEIKHIFLMALVPLLAVAGFVAMYHFGYLALASGSGVSGGVTMFLFIVVGLAIPYFMVKLGVHESAHISNQPEKDLSFSDIPKDKENLWEEKDDNFTNPS